VHELTQQAFAGYGWLNPPSGVFEETVEVVTEDLRGGHGLVARIEGRPVGCLRFREEADRLHVRRLAVRPDLQHQGIGSALMRWIHDHAGRKGLRRVTLGVRRQLPQNRGFYEKLGYRVIAEHRHPGFDEVTWEEMELALF
jgi:tRNA threonylcarbamoyladenosine biosynthesis protein TsaE